MLKFVITFRRYSKLSNKHMLQILFLTIYKHNFYRNFFYCVCSLSPLQETTLIRPTIFQAVHQLVFVVVNLTRILNSSERFFPIGTLDPGALEPSPGRYLKLILLN